MMLDLVLRLAAEEDLRAAYSWYESLRDGLGDEFVLCVNHAMDQARQAPSAFACVHRDVRRVLLRRFPYALFYLVEPRRIVVLGVLHASRDPARRPTP